MKRAICLLLAGCSFVAVAGDANQPAKALAMEFLGARNTCYFIRTLRPLPTDTGASKSGFIPVQAKITGIVHGPDCTNSGALVPLLPVVEKITASPAGEASP